jgi:hypothetical protein
LRWVIVASLVLSAAICLPRPAQASRGTPDSPEFAYGARLDLQGRYLDKGVYAAAELRLDWVSVDLDWGAIWPDPNIQPDLANLDLVMQSAKQFGYSVLIGLRHAPAWASSANGPDPKLTAWFVVNLERRYGDTFKAVEPFPSANTTDGWGTTPDAAAYVELLRSLQAALKDAGLSLLIVSGGLTPLAPDGQEGAIDDLKFLQNLYDAGGKEFMPIISIRLGEVTGDPLQAASQSEHRVLRHYEEVRQVMLANHHENGILWITDLSWPDGTIASSDSTAQSVEAQAVWMSQAFSQLRAQLYIGAAFLHRLNPPGGKSATAAENMASLIRANLSRHPFFELLGQMTAQNKQSTAQPLLFDQPQHKNFGKLRP